MFGYAITDTPELMPLPIALAHRLSRRLTEVRKSGVLDYLRPDGKTQVTVQYDGTTPVRLDTVVLSTQHADGIDLEARWPRTSARRSSTPCSTTWRTTRMDTSDYRLLVNPTGKFVLGGPMGDAGLTGRKIIVDTYGGWARHGGGAFSGKDPSKVDRSAAYAMRWVAKNVVAAGLAERVEVQVAYAIGKAAPVGPVRRDVRHRDRRPGPYREGHHRGVRPAARRDHPRPGPAASDLRADCRLRTLRSHRHRPAMGAARQGRRAEGIGLVLPPSRRKLAQNSGR